MKKQYFQLELVQCKLITQWLIPVDYLPFYLTHSEYISLPPGSAISQVWCKIYPLGTRTAFDTGTTLSGSATSEYIPIGMCGVGINRDFYGYNKSYSVDASKPMIPTGITNINHKEIVKKYYEHIASNTMLVPRSISEYFVHSWNRSANPDKTKYPDYQVHNAGVVHMDEKIDSFMINSMINQPIIQYVYIPKNGKINDAKEHFVPYERKSNTLESEFRRSRSNALQFFNNSSTNEPQIGAIGLGKEHAPNYCINSPEESYYRQIENYGTFSPQTGVTSFHAQPQVHVGIQATPQLNPGNEDTNFLNSCAYWRVECGCTISYSISSAFTKQSPISWPREVSFLESSTPTYTDGRTLFGNTDARNGVLLQSMQDVIEEEYEIIQNPKKKKRHV